MAGNGTRRKLSERERIRQLEALYGELLVLIPQRVDAVIARALKPLRMELDLLSLIIKEKTNLSQDEADGFRRRLLVMHMHLEAATSIGNGLATFGQHPEIMQLVVNYMTALADAAVPQELPSPAPAPVLEALAGDEAVM